MEAASNSLPEPDLVPSTLLPNLAAGSSTAGGLVEDLFLNVEAVV